VDIPAIATTPKIRVRTYPKGIVQQVRNPLYSYLYQQAARDGQFGPWFSGMTTTQRCSSEDAQGAKQRMIGADLGAKVVSQSAKISQTKIWQASISGPMSVQMLT